MQDFKYSVRRDGRRWRWQVNAAGVGVLASGVAKTHSAARVRALAFGMQRWNVVWNLKTTSAHQNLEDAVVTLTRADKTCASALECLRVFRRRKIESAALMTKARAAIRRSNDVIAMLGASAKR